MTSPRSFPNRGKLPGRSVLDTGNLHDDLEIWEHARTNHPDEFMYVLKHFPPIESYADLYEVTTPDIIGGKDKAKSYTALFEVVPSEQLRSMVNMLLDLGVVIEVPQWQPSPAKS